MTDASTTRNLGRNDPCWCGSGSKYKRCHAGADLSGTRRRDPAKPSAERVANRVRPGRLSPRRGVPTSIERPSYVANGGVPTDEQGPLTLRTPDEIDRMRRTGRAAGELLASMAERIKPGITTDELDAIVHERAIEIGAYPSPLGYQGFPKSVCTSVNEVICHGIPDDRPLAEGDILNIDVTIFREGVHGDTSRMFRVGEISDERERLIEITERAMYAGIGAGVAGAQVRDIGTAIQKVAQPAGLGIVRSFVGHGVGPAFHSAPTVFHYEEPSATTRIEPGMTFTVEPMLNLGAWQHTMWNDGWTAVSIDLSDSAQFEHTVLVREDGVELLTVPDGAPQPFLH